MKEKGNRNRTVSYTHELEDSYFKDIKLTHKFYASCIKIAMILFIFARKENLKFI